MFPEPIIELGKIKIYMYGVCIAVGILCAILVLRLFGKKLKVDKKFLDFVETDAYLAIVVGFLFSAIFQGLYNYIKDPSVGFRLDGGITFLGGLIGGAASWLIIYFICKKKYKASFKDVISIIPCCIFIAHAFGRIGCFCAGCCYGIEVEEGLWYSWMGVDFPEVPGVVLPTQLIEAIFLFIMFGVTTILCLKKNYRHNFSLYMISYGVFRFFIEFVRNDERGSFVGNMSPSQFWSILLVVAGIALIFLTNKVIFKKNKDSDELEQTEAEEDKKEEEKELTDPDSELVLVSEEVKEKDDVLEFSEAKIEEVVETESLEKEEISVDTDTEEIKEEVKVVDEMPFAKTKVSEDQEEIQVEEVVDDKHMERMRKQLEAQRKLREEVETTPKKSISLEEKLGKKL